jgi:hypothetical protein
MRGRRYKVQRVTKSTTPASSAQPSTLTADREDPPPLVTTSDDITHNTATDTFYFACPHCGQMCEVPRDLIRCTIFRHAVFKQNMQFVPPHAPKAECDRWIREGLVWGCGRPFRFDGRTVSVIGYI